MNINDKARDLAVCIKNTKEFKLMNKAKKDIDKNPNVRKQFNEYIKKKNNIYSRYKIVDTSKKINQLNKDYNKFFNNPLIINYLNANKQFNIMMENLYKQIEHELTK